MSNLSILDLLVSGRLLSEGLYGVLKPNPDNADSILFSEAFAPKPDKDTICRWVSIPKSLVAYVEPLGTGYCCESQGFPFPNANPYVRLWLSIPQDANGAALAQLLASALRRLSSQKGDCGCGGSKTSDYPWPVYNCPQNKRLIDKVWVRSENQGGDNWRWTIRNDTDYSVQVDPVYSYFTQGSYPGTLNLQSQQCQGYQLVQAHSDGAFFFNTTWNPTTGGTEVTIWDSYYDSASARGESSQRRMHVNV